MRGWVVGLVVATLAIVVLGVGVVAILLGAGGSTSLVDLEPGDCFDLPDDVGDEILAVDTIDCAEPHLAEVVAIGELRTDPEAPYPGDELFGLVDAECRRRSGGVPDAFGLLPIAPTEALWESFDGRYVCVAVPFGGEPVTGSIVAG